LIGFSLSSLPFLPTRDWHGVIFVSLFSPPHLQGRTFWAGSVASLSLELEDQCREFFFPPRVFKAARTTFLLRCLLPLTPFSPPFPFPDEEDWRHVFQSAFKKIKDLSRGFPTICNGIFHSSLASQMISVFFFLRSSSRSANSRFPPSLSPFPFSRWVARNFLNIGSNGVPPSGLPLSPSFLCMDSTRTGHVCEAPIRGGSPFPPLP